MQNTEEHFPNGLKVSKADNPMFFPVENTYQVGSAEILALMSNTIAVGTGQTGDAPLYIFCKDGVYAAFVDASGEMVYPNTRPLAPDVCNNPRSVTRTDLGVIFTTDRGLMRMAGNQVEEIGAPAEGDVLKWFNSSFPAFYSKIATDAFRKVAGLPTNLYDTTDFLTYLKGSIVNYNHNLRELIITNPSKKYSYVMDRAGNWSRRDYTAVQYVNNYPTSYRLTSAGSFYKVDEEGDDNTPLEQRKEATNQFFYLSNVIKLDSIGFKQAYRFVVRGYFETTEIVKTYTDLKAVDRITITPAVLYNNKTLYDVPTLYAAIKIGDRVQFLKDGNHQEVIVTDKMVGPDRLEFSEVLDAYSSYGEYSISKQSPLDPSVSCVIEGSYDGRKWSPLGFNRKSGQFTDIGCKISHTDMRFFRVCLAGQVTGKTRIDGMEISHGASVLNTKIR